MRLTDLPLFLRVPEFAREARIGTTKAWELVRSGEVESVRFGRSVRVPRRVLSRIAGEDEEGRRSRDARSGGPASND